MGKKRHIADWFIAKHLEVEPALMALCDVPRSIFLSGGR